jgi:hypothetical protein
MKAMVLRGPNTPIELIRVPDPVAGGENCDKLPVPSAA